MIYFENEFKKARKKSDKYNTRVKIIYNFLIEKLTNKIKDELVFYPIMYNNILFMCEFVHISYYDKYLRIHLTFFAHTKMRKINEIRLEKSRDMIKEHSLSFPQNSKYAKTIWMDLFICDKIFEIDFKRLIKDNFSKYCEDLDVIYKI